MTAEDILISVYLARLEVRKARRAVKESLDLEDPEFDPENPKHTEHTLRLKEAQRVLKNLAIRARHLCIKRLKEGYQVKAYERLYIR
jgi:hypothetical protein